MCNTGFCKHEAGQGHCTEPDNPPCLTKDTNDTQGTIQMNKARERGDMNNIVEVAQATLTGGYSGKARTCVWIFTAHVENHVTLMENLVTL